jgi:membrane protease subunit HflC
MREKWFTVTIILLATIGMLLFLFVYTVREDQVVVHKRFGEITDVHQGSAEGEAGWYFRFPPPIDSVQTYDARIRGLRPVKVQQMLRDGNTVVGFTFVTYQLTDPEKLQQRAEDERAAVAELEAAVNNALGNELGERTLSELVNTDAESVKLKEIEDNLLSSVRESDVPEYGLTVHSVNITALRFPDNVTKSVFERMIAEREKKARALIDAGESAKAKAQFEAQKVARNMETEARKQAKEMLAEAESKAIEYYEQLTQAPDLANFLRRLDAFQEVANQALRNQQPLLFVLTAATEPFAALRGGEFEGEMPELPRPVLEDEAGAAESSAAPTGETETAGTATGTEE